MTRSCAQSFVIKAKRQGHSSSRKMRAMSNPLLDFNDLPLFDQIRPEHVAPAIDALLAESEGALEKVVAPDFPPSWQSLAQTLDCTTERLSRAWGAVSHLNSVADTPELRAAY